jgi:hypothetical protein
MHFLLPMCYHWCSQVHWDILSNQPEDLLGSCKLVLLIRLSPEDRGRGTVKGRWASFVFHQNNTRVQEPSLCIYSFDSWSLYQDSQINRKYRCRLPICMQNLELESKRLRLLCCFSSRHTKNCVQQMAYCKWIQHQHHLAIHHYMY